MARINRGLTLFLLLWVSAAAAQEISPLEPPNTERYLRWGPVRVRPGLTIPTFGYDSNVFYAPDNSDDQVGDYFINISPRVDGLVLFGDRAFLTFSERLEFYVYANEHEVDYFNQLGRARLTIPLGNYGFYVDGGYDRIRDRPIDNDDVRPIRKEIPFGAGMIFKFGWRTDAEFGYARSRFTGEDPDALPCDPVSGCFTIEQRIDRVEDGLRLSARYLMFGRTRFTLRASERDIVFDDPAVQRDAHERRIVPGLDFGLGGRISGTLRAGWANFNLDNPAAEDFQGAVADIALVYRLGGLGSSLTFRGQRDIRYSVLESTDLYTYSGGDLGFVRYFNRFIGMELGGGRYTLDFLGDPDNREDDISRGSAGVRFRLSENDLGRRVEYAFRYVLTRRNSTDDSLDQTRGTIGFGLSFGY